ncbi:relaxase/mobilization nuclease domain-containing protein [Nocardia wallacei]|uniref:relaxase/mobilization nuclease domain-containing protein n=1 Tax=Nocardia wallacei TaxID=480035 RepID=UPI002454A0E0|nr:relaxase/mobilization nuclease domain-containing protein [Nocardia wallacei]
MSGLMVYLLGPGEHNEHTDRHIVTGSPTIMQARWLQHFDGPAADAAARQVALEVAGEVEIPRKLYGTQVRMRAKPVAARVGGRGGAGSDGLDIVEPAAKGEKGEMRDAPVWHCVLALEPGETLDDAKWAQLTQDFMDRMTFTGTPDGKRAQARWAAVRHGLSGEQGEGQEHIHIAASLVREDGSKVNTYDYGPGKKRGDWRRAQEVCNELEHEYGLKVLLSREQGGGLSGDSRAEQERAKRENRPESERDRLRRMVRATATTVDTEAEFVEALREAGVSVRPRYAPGGRTEVQGYSVRLRRDGTEVGPWLGGGKLGRDLTLTALRDQQWHDTDQTRRDALAVWATPASARARRGERDVDDPQKWQQAAAEIGQWRERLAEIPPSDRAQWAWVAGQAAGVFAAWSEALEGDEPGPFAAAHKELARSAQVSYASQRYRPPAGHAGLTGLGGVAKILWDESYFRAGRALWSSRPGQPGRREDPAEEMAMVLLAAMLVLLLLAIAVAMEVAQAHRARGELTWAMSIEQATRYGMDPVRVAWEAGLNARRHQWDRDAAQVFAAGAERRAAKQLGHSDIDEQQGAERSERAADQLDPDRLAALVADAEELVPDITDAEAWPALCERLAAIEVAGGDAAEQLAAAIAMRELGTADDIAAVLVWRLEQLDTAEPAATPDPAAAPRQEPDRPWRRSAAVAAAQGPLSPPTPRRGPRAPYYTELSEEDRELRLVHKTSSIAFAGNDVDPASWNDARLAQELADRRTEVRLLTEDIENRRTGGGPVVRRVVADNAVLAAAAEKIPDAQAARERAEALDREKQLLLQQQIQLQQEIEQTSRLRMAARRKLQDRLDDTTTRLADLGPEIEQAHTDARTAAAAVGIPEHDWTRAMQAADPQQQQRRVDRAAVHDRRALDRDQTMLHHLERDLDPVEREAARRAKLTPEQRAAADRAPRRSRQRWLPTTDLGTSLGPSHRHTHGPSHGPGQGHDHGPSL